MCIYLFVYILFMHAIMFIYRLLLDKNETTQIYQIFVILVT